MKIVNKIIALTSCEINDFNALVIAKIPFVFDSNFDFTIGSNSKNNLTVINFIIIRAYLRIVYVLLSYHQSSSNSLMFNFMQ